MDRRNIAALVYVIALHFAGISLPIVSPLIDAVVPFAGVVSGPKEILIVYETETARASFERMLTNLRTGDADKYFASKNHTLLALDVNAKDGDGNPAKPLVKWQKGFDGLTLPVLVIGTPAGKIAHKQALNVDATADQVLAIIKAKGG